MALAATTASAQMTEFDSLFRQFGSCLGGEFGGTQKCNEVGKAGAQCCDFVVVQDSSITGQFCVTDGQREGEYEGTYRDYDYTLWKWQCKEPDQLDDVDDKGAGDDLDLGPYSNYNDKTMEWILWVTYLSQELWILGWPVSIPMGMGYTTWLWIVSVIQLFEGKGTFDEWAAGPFLSYWFVQPFIFWSSLVLSIIPGVNFLTAFLFGWWANLDYY